ncbi:MAG: MBL fold metallo-hydrolase [Thermoleophilia bacterium]|nr:MBL fold metallo-hydrolase [Gaiellaceae bacterium]MDW8338095.1 MBL fold metallo-hydrolase [Thermoleophilia bacterium]
MIFAQLVDDALGCASYLVADPGSGEAVVVDPAFAIEPYLAEAERRGVRIVRTIETHTHADHLSGHGRLALEHGIPVSIHPLADPSYPFDPLEDGTEIVLGDVVLRALHTPGHRPEHTCLLVSDRTRAAEPWLVLTGDSLFVGDVARPDLAVEAREGAEGLFSSLQRLMELPDGVEVYPGHVAGSLCGKAMSSKASTTIGFERRFNPALAFSEVAAFIAATAALETPRPPNMERIVELNRGPFVGATPPPRRLDVPTEAAQVLDVRPVEEFARGHLPGAISVPVAGSRFSTKAAFVLDPERPVVIVASNEGEVEEAARGLRSVAYLDLPGYVLDGGSETLALLPPTALGELVPDGAVLVDVREPDEAAADPFPRSRAIPYRALVAEELDLPRDRPIVTLCESGPRAVIAASLLAARGYDARAVFPGGIDDLR